MAYGLEPLFGALFPWDLHPRDIPMPVESACPLKSIRHSSSTLAIEKWQDFFAAKSILNLEPRSKHRLELEFETHSTAYVRFGCAPAFDTRHEAQAHLLGSL